MLQDFNFKDKYGFEDLAGIMALLRSGTGCPWDREQTHKSIRANFIEETYEVIEAIDNDDAPLLKEELGDVLLQIVFHAQMEKEKGIFDISDVIDGICQKLIIRHPHVFGEVKVENSEQVLKNWDEIKKQTKGQKSQTEVIKTIPRVLPALMRSYKVQQRAAKVGFDWQEVSGALSKTHEELEELEQAIAQGDSANSKEELGDLLFAAVNVSQFINAEPEEALTAACNKFIARFSIVEKLAQQQGRGMNEMSLEELDKLWNRAKSEL